MPYQPVTDDVCETLVCYQSVEVRIIRKVPHSEPTPISTDWLFEVERIDTRERILRRKHELTKLTKLTKKAALAANQNG